MALFGVCLFQCRYPLTQARALRWSMGLMGKRRARPFTRGARGRAFTHVARSVQASRKPRSNSLPCSPLRGGRCLRVLPRASASRRWRAAADRGTARCGRRARKPEQGPGRFNNPRVRSPPASFATAPAKRREGARARRPGREGAPLQGRPCSRTQLNFVL